MRKDTSEPCCFKLSYWQTSGNEIYVHFTLCAELGMKHLFGMQFNNACRQERCGNNASLIFVNATSFQFAKLLHGKYFK